MITLRHTLLLALLLLGPAGLAGCSKRTVEIGVTPTASSASATTPMETPASAEIQTPEPAAAATTTPLSRSYADSCAAGYPWGRQVNGPFVCLQSPPSGITLAASQVVTGYAGGSFENSVLVELYDENNVAVVSQVLTYSASDIGTPGSWRVTVDVPPGPASGSPGRIVVSFSSARDGALVALDSIDVRFP